MPNQTQVIPYQISLPKGIELTECIVVNEIIRQLKIMDADFAFPYVEPYIRRIYKHLVTFRMLDRQAKMQELSQDVDPDIWIKTFNHLIEVAATTEYVAGKLELSQQLTKYMIICALTHDVGKNKVPINVCGYTKNLRKFPKQWEEMKRHTIYGTNQLLMDREVAHYAMAAQLHHKFLTGEGYPVLPTDKTGIYSALRTYSQILRGVDIRLKDAILTIAVLKVTDSLAAMCAKRSYRPPMNLEIAMKTLIESECKLNKNQINKAMRIIDRIQKRKGHSDKLATLDCLINELSAAQLQCLVKDSQNIANIQAAIYYLVAVEILCKELTPGLYKQLAVNSDKSLGKEQPKHSNNVHKVSRGKFNIYRDC